MSTLSLLDEYLTPKALATELNIKTSTLDRWRRLNVGPPLTKIGRKTYYARQTVAEWLKAQEQHKTRKRAVA
jgi:hypothetical protein